MSVYAVIACDGEGPYGTCLNKYVSVSMSTTAYIVRAAASQEDWHRSKGKDLCPECWEKGQR